MNRRELIDADGGKRVAKPIPRAAFDSTLALLREGYDFISARCRRMNTDIFATRLMLRPAICVRGAEAAEMFYGGDHFTRIGAMPQTTLRLLQDKAASTRSTAPLTATARRFSCRSCWMVTRSSGSAQPSVAPGSTSWKTGSGVTRSSCSTP
ncbi:hypothetical protein NKJ73_27915 [Mesorhizobium sp. M0074]|uniref:hypothetical protein n=1 Tax=Mesorhizobium sp. M0074 TaxID=2956869 RepID=UPI0033388439